MKMKKQILILFFWVVFAGSQKLCAQPPLPIVKNATISVSVAFDRTNRAFLYTYKVTNSSESVGSIGSFEFDISAPPGSQTLQLNSLIDYQGADEAWLNGFRQRLGNTIVPLVFVSSNGWEETFSIHRQAGWFSSLSKGEIDPGQSLDNLAIESPGLVGIRNFVVEPPFDPNDFLPHVDELPNTPDLPQKIAQIEQQLAQMEQEIKFRGQTLGPTVLPQNCDPACMVQFLMNEKEQAFQLGWIDNAGVANALDKKLEEAKKKLREGDIETAGHILKSFILDLEAQHREEEPENEHGQKHEHEKEQADKHVTDNAYYLLKPNAEFILFKLSQQKEKREKENEK